MNRRSLLKLLASGVVGYTLDVDRLLWVPGQKKFFLPSKKILTASEIIIAEWTKVIPKVQGIFERDTIFYNMIKQESFLTIASREMKIPLQMRPGRA